MYLEDGPNNDPATNIYGGTSPTITVSGDIGTITSGQAVHIDIDLLNGRNNMPVPGGHLTLDFKCP